MKNYDPGNNNGSINNSNSSIGNSDISNNSNIGYWQMVMEMKED